MRLTRATISISGTSCSSLKRLSPKKLLDRSFSLSSQKCVCTHFHNLCGSRCCLSDRPSLSPLAYVTSSANMCVWKRSPGQTLELRLRPRLVERILFFCPRHFLLSVRPSFLPSFLNFRGVEEGSAQFAHLRRPGHAPGPSHAIPSPETYIASLADAGGKLDRRWKGSANAVMLSWRTSELEKGTTRDVGLPSL